MPKQTTTQKLAELDVRVQRLEIVAKAALEIIAMFESFLTRAQTIEKESHLERS
jgi:citrate lyase gamma subunit